MAEASRRHGGGSPGTTIHATQATVAPAVFTSDRRRSWETYEGPVWVGRDGRWWKGGNHPVS